MSDSEDSRIYDPAGVQDDRSDHSGDGTQGDESDDEDHEDTPDLVLNPEELATQGNRARVAVRLRAALLAQEKAQQSLHRVRRLSTLFLRNRVLNCGLSAQKSKRENSGPSGLYIGLTNYWLPGVGYLSFHEWGVSLSGLSLPWRDTICPRYLPLCEPYPH